MNDTRATVRKEILEDAKAEIDARIEKEYQWKSLYEDFLQEHESEGVKNALGRVNSEIDRLLLEKDNLPDVLFSDRADEIEPTEADAQALERRLAELANYDFTPFPKDMPDINIETTDEIPF